MVSLDTLDDSSKFHILKMSGLDAQIAMGILPQQFRIYAILKKEKARNFVMLIRAVNSFLHHLDIEFNKDGLTFLQTNKYLFEGKIDDFDYYYAKEELKTRIEVRELYNFIDGDIDELKLVVEETSFIQCHIISDKLEMYQKLRLLEFDEDKKASKLIISRGLEIDTRLFSRIVRKFDEFLKIKIEIVEDKIRFKANKPSGENMMAETSINSANDPGELREIYVAQSMLNKFCLYTRSNLTTIHLKNADYPLIINANFGSNHLLFGLLPQSA